MTKHPIVSLDDQKVTFVELFFDLVFVFSVTQIVHLLHGHLDIPSAGSALLVFWLVWWAWTQFTWALNAANTDHARVQGITLLATAVAFFMAVGVSHAFTDPVGFALAYVAVRVIGLLLYYWVAWGDVEQRRAVTVFGLYSASGLVAVLAGAIVGGSALYWLWSAAIFLDLLAAGVGGQLEGWNLHAEHFAERHGLIVIIALGETLIVAASGVSAAAMSIDVIVIVVLTVAVICALWWSYFPYARPVLEHVIATRKGSARSSLARDVYSVIHFPMLCGIIAIAVVEEQLLAHPEEPLEMSARLALAAGAALFLGGTTVALWRATGKMLFTRWLLTFGVAGSALLLGATPWLALTMMLLLIVIIAATDRTTLVHR